MDKMKIEIWSDIACPYCYIGKRKLEMALEKFEHKDKVELKWKSYELDPSLPKKALDKSFYDYFSEKFDVSIDKAKQQQQEVVDLAQEVGLNYNFDKLIVANTSDALRLVKLAAKAARATQAEEVIFKAYFEDGKDISDRATLVQLGAEIGLDADSINEMLDSDRFYGGIKKDMELAENKFNLEYIPFYRLNFNQIIQGSIEIEDYLTVLKQAYTDWESGSTSEGDTISGKSCSIDGICS